jgi:hypothetical protein
MTTDLNRRDPLRRPHPSRHKLNPFQDAPAPIPLSGWNLRAPDIFGERSLAANLERNAGWLQARPRTSNAIEAALFPEYALCGMAHEEVRSLMNAALWDAGYVPSSTGTGNPTWSWTEGE